ncbi:MAG: S8 family peptidase [Firmicutes bacterium]|nr:S8 family peptidase [Bacillota bacterium]MCL1953445.1 S8 family peptidase [Bacillota bacterium]
MENERKRLAIDACHDMGFKGKGITVAVLDTGIKPHLDFVIGVNRIVEFWSVDRGKGIPFDNNGHGTAVCGILAGSGLLSNGKYMGVAPQANLVGVKVIADNGVGDTNAILDGMNFVFKNKKRLNIKVACMSFGSEPLEPDPIMKGAELLWEQGIVVVASSGNNGPAQSTVRSPGATPQILTVGGMDFDKDDKPYVVDFSSRGPWGDFSRPDLVAPAVDIFTPSLTKPYAVMSGTSMSAPIVAGAAALLLGINPNLQPDQVKQLLLSTATFVDNDKNASGWGLIDIGRAIESLSNNV